MKIYQSIAKVQNELADTGIAKSNDNKAQGYKFRGIDDVYNSLSKLLPKHNLVILPRVLDRECVERINHKGTALFYTTVNAEFDFVNTEDGSKHTIKTYGEAMDSGDKSTNKAMSAAYKYACFMTFCIPTEGDNDSENNSHEIDPHKGQMAKTPLTEDQIKAFEETIKKAETAEELRKQYTNAYRFAQSQSDQNAIEKILTVYANRKQELGIQP